MHLVCIFDHQVIYPIRVSSREHWEGISEAILRHSVGIYLLNTKGILKAYIGKAPRGSLVEIFWLVFFFLDGGKKKKNKKRKEKSL